MKKRYSLFALLIATPSMALAGLKLPSRIYVEADLEKAKTEAASKGKPLAILYTDKDSTCPLCNNASATMIKELGSKTIMVYAPDINSLPKPVKEALSAGKYIPKIAVFDDKLENTLGTVTYEAVKENARTAFRSVDKAIREYKKEE